MGPITILILSISMSVDAFAAAVAKGAAERPDFKIALRGGALFGIVEAITPLIGFALGTIASDLLEAVDHWVAFGLLGLVGAHLIMEGIKGRDPELAVEGPRRKSSTLRSVGTAVGTSIDAAAVGVSLAFLDVNIWVVAAAIGVSTFVLTTVGLTLGGRVGQHMGRWAEIGGGVALIGIGSLILAEHLDHLPDIL